MTGRRKMPVHSGKVRSCPTALVLEGRRLEEVGCRTTDTTETDTNWQQWYFSYWCQLIPKRAMVSIAKNEAESGSNLRPAIRKNLLVHRANVPALALLGNVGLVLFLMLVPYRQPMLELFPTRRFRDWYALHMPGHWGLGVLHWISPK